MYQGPPGQDPLISMDDIYPLLRSFLLNSWLAALNLPTGNRVTPFLWALRLPCRFRPRPRKMGSISRPLVAVWSRMDGQLGVYQGLGLLTWRTPTAHRRAPFLVSPCPVPPMPPAFFFFPPFSLLFFSCLFFSFLGSPSPNGKPQSPLLCFLSVQDQAQY